ncbi:MAG: FixH family protein [Thermoanaerobaculia bacterium]
MTARLRSAVLLAGLLLAGCRPAADTSDTIDLAWTVSPETPAAGSATFDIRLKDKASGRPVTGATVKLEGDMTHPGMQPVFSTAREASPGRYHAAMRFTMSGDWVILLDATLADRRTVHRQMDLRGVRVP